MSHGSERQPPAGDASDSRRADRLAIDGQVSLRRSAKLNYRVRAYDVSLYGCRVEFVERPALAERVWVKFDGLEAVEGLVCWAEGFVVGIEYVRPMHPAVFEALMPRLR